MTKENLHGYVILFKGTKELVATKRIRLYQREKLVDKLLYLIPYDYAEFNRQSEVYPDLSAFTCQLLYVTYDGTVHSEILQRMKDSAGEYVDYEDNDGNVTHMIYQLPINTNISQFAGDIKMKLNLQYIDYSGETVSDSDEESAPDPTPEQYVLQSDDITITILSVADYYSIVPDESLSVINQKIAELQTKQEQLEATAQVYDQGKADSIELHISRDRQCLRLTSHGEPIGEEVDLNTLGDEISTWQQAGMIKVITDEDEPTPPTPPTPSGDYANDIILVVNERERALYLTHNGRKIGTPIYLEDLGIAVSDADPQGLIKVITDDSETGE